MEKCTAYTPKKDSWAKGQCVAYVHTGVRGWCKISQCPCDGHGNYEPEKRSLAPTFQSGIPDHLYYREVPFQ